MGERFGSFEELAKLKYGMKVPEKENTKPFTFIEDKTAVPASATLVTGKPPTAPYNFVPLNTVAVKPALAKYVDNAKDAESMQNGYKNFIKDGKKYSGYFDVEIENLTPLYIGGNDAFFANQDNICIPGSSLRGCIKNIFKIVTNSGLNTGDDPDLTDKHLYYRAMASGYKDLRDSYDERMVSTGDVNPDGTMSSKSKAEAGFIVRKDKKYFVCPAQYAAEKPKGKWSVVKRIANPDTPYVKWENNNTAKVFTGKMSGRKIMPKWKVPKDIDPQRVKNLSNGKVQVDTPKIHYYKVYAPRWDKCLEIPDYVIRDYCEDKRRKGLDLLDEKNNLNLHNAVKGQGFDYIIPCFYIADADTVEHFGAGPYYRIPYKQSIGVHIPQDIKNIPIDFTNAVFGNKEYWASRVYFEDSFLKDKQVPQFDEKDYPKVLMTPNPTSFQFYLNTDKGQPRHWDQEAAIRGYKFYWHRKLDWHETKEEMRKDSINKQIEPLKAYHTFQGKIRFKNLDAAELGAMAYVLSLCQDHENTCLKLGMGKPIGMGTINMTAKLHIQGKDYYEHLFGGSGFADAELVEDMSKFTKEFHGYVEHQLSSAQKKNYDGRINAMLAILNTEYMNKNKWNTECTRYMTVGDKNYPDDKSTLNKRVPLPTIKEVIKKIK